MSDKGKSEQHKERVPYPMERHKDKTPPVDHRHDDATERQDDQQGGDGVDHHVSVIPSKQRAKGQPDGRGDGQIAPPEPDSERSSNGNLTEHCNRLPHRKQYTTNKTQRKVKAFCIFMHCVYEYLTFSIRFCYQSRKRPFGLEDWTVKFAMDRKNQMNCTMMQKSTIATAFYFSASSLLLPVLSLLLITLLTILLVVIC